MKTIGERLSVARKNRNLTQTDVAARVNITPQMVSKWERDESLPDVIMLKRLSEILQVPLTYFYGEADLDIAAQSNKTVDTKKQSGVSLNEHKWNGNDFSDSNLTALDFAYARFTDCNLSACNITEKSFSYTEFIGCKLNGTKLNEGKMFRVDFVDCEMSGGDFSATKLDKSDFKKCNLSGIVLKGTTLEDTAFIECKLENIDFLSVNLTNCTLKNLVLKGCRFENAIFSKCKFKDVKFVDCTTDKLSYNFLLSCMADVSGLNYK